jgi:hypothetical protein
MAGGDAGRGRRRRENAGHAGLTARPGLAAADFVEPGPFGLVVFCRRVGPGVERRRRAQYNKAPFMYEMKGALSGRALPARPVARLPRRRAPPAGAKHPPEPPVSRLFPCPEVAPGWCPFPTVKLFLLPSRQPRKSLREFILGFSVSTRCPQNAADYPHVTAVIHRPMHNTSTIHPQVTRGNSENTKFGVLRGLAEVVERKTRHPQKLVGRKACARSNRAFRTRCRVG